MNRVMLVNSDDTYFAVVRAPFRIGSSGSCDLRLKSDKLQPEDDKKATRFAVLNRDERGSYALYVDTVPSPVKIRVNGKLVDRRTELRDGDVIEIGKQGNPKSARLRYLEVPLHDGARVSERWGCEYCLKTLDPNDPDKQYRSAVVVDGKPYHRKCWEISPEQSRRASPLVLQVPPALTAGAGLNAPVPTGAANTLYDVPLGISDTLLNLGPARKGYEFSIRNNDRVVLKVDRREMPSWAYVDYGPPYEPDMFMQVLPGTDCTITVHPNCVRPAKQTYRLALGERQGINLEPKGNALVWPAALFAFWTVYLLYVITLWDLYRQTAGSGGLGQIHFQAFAWPLTALTLLLAAVFYLTPAKIIWGACTLVNSAQQIRVLTKDFARDLKGGLLSAFSKDWIDHRMWPLIALGCGTAAALIILAIVWVLFALGLPELNAAATFAAFLVPLVLVSWVAR